MSIEKSKELKFIVSGGGTGGHIFPAISIANAIKEHHPEAKILFVGALGRMEMERVPSAGYKIIGLPVAGFNRRIYIKNIPVVFKLFKSLRLAKRIVKNFEPDIVIGVGGYASGPVLRAASAKKIPTLIQEQNSYAGVTNKLLAKNASVICVAYEGMERFFPADKIVLTGNPTRQDLFISPKKREQAYSHFSLDKNKKTILMVGGSLGAKTLNDSIVNAFDKLAQSDVQVIWQCGNYYYQDMKLMQAKGQIPSNIKLMAFVSRMDLAYAVADLVISRAGAGSISELSLLGKPVILVPSPNVSEDHQTQNALALVNKDAAIMVKDVDARAMLFEAALQTINNDGKLIALHQNILKLAQHDSANRIVDEINKVII